MIPAGVERLHLQDRTEGGERTMASTRFRKIFVNLPVRDLKKSMDFFTALGFSFNKQFTDDKAACMVISEEAFVMLLTEPFFKTFTKQALCDTGTATEGLFALSCESRAESISS
jgi:predicted lactoylglutathione lyase